MKSDYFVSGDVRHRNAACIATIWARRAPMSPRRAMELRDALFPSRTPLIDRIAAAFGTMCEIVAIAMIGALFFEALRLANLH